MSTFTYGAILVGVGATVALADGTELDFGPTASVAALTVAVVVLVAGVLSTRAKADPGDPGDPQESTTGTDPQDDLDPDSEGRDEVEAPSEPHP